MPRDSDKALGNCCGLKQNPLTSTPLLKLPKSREEQTQKQPQEANMTPKSIENENILTCVRNQAQQTQTEN